MQLSVNLSINVLVSDMLTDRKKMSYQREITLIKVKKMGAIFVNYINMWQISCKAIMFLFSPYDVFSKCYLHRGAQIHVFQYYNNFLF